MNNIKQYFYIINDKDILVKSINISLIVGTILNFINQGAELISLDFESINFYKLLLTYTIPFLVSSYTAVSMKLKFTIGDVSTMDATLTCKGCKSVIAVHKHGIIPLCIKCKEKTKWRLSNNG